MKEKDTLRRNLLQRIVDRITSIETATYFLIIGGIIGLGFVIVTPPFQGWDEREHFYRAYQVSQLNVKPDVVVAPNAANVPGSEASGFGGSFPQTTVRGVDALHRNENKEGVYDYSLIGRLNQRPTDFDQQRAVRFDNTAIYSPAGYIPQSLAIGAANATNSSFVVAFYAARIAGLVFWLGLMYLAIRLLPVGKKVLLVLALNPVSIFLAATLSPDAAAFGFISLVIALLLKVVNDKKKMSLAMTLTVGVLIVLTVLIKNVYLPVILSLLLVPRSIMGVWWKVGIGLIAGISALLWNISIYSVTAGIPSYFGVMDNIGATAQLENIIDHPLKFISVVVWNVLGTNSVLVNQTYAGIFDRNPVPDWVVFVWIVSLAAAVTCKEKTVELMKHAVRKRTSWVLAGVWFMTVGLIVTSLYLGWSIVGDKDIMGVQGRYFIPISFLILMPLILSTKYFIGTHKAVRNILVYLVLPVGLAVTVASLSVRYVIGT